MPAEPAANHSAARNPLVRAFTRGSVAIPANDDGCWGSDSQVLRAALLHFAEHGLSAAQAAFVEAERAFDAGDRHTASAWVNICAAFDRRLAASLAARVDAVGP